MTRGEKPLTRPPLSPPFHCIHKRRNNKDVSTGLEGVDERDGAEGGGNGGGGGGGGGRGPQRSAYKPKVTFVLGRVRRRSQSYHIR